jgi:hypothetical protein
MASTRNINTPGNYCLQQREFKQSQIYTLYPNSQYGAAYNTRLPGNGLLPGQMPGNKLSHNSADIESFLLGINSTNLVNPAPCFVPELANLSSANIFDKGPTYMPEPLVIEKKQRPFPIPN